MKYLTLFISILLTIVFTSCKKTYNCDEPVRCEGELLTLRDLAGLDGCSWVFEDGNTRYEPINLDSMNVTLRDGELYYVQFDTVDAASICMVGPLIEISCIDPLVLTTQ